MIMIIMSWEGSHVIQGHDHVMEGSMTDTLEPYMRAFRIEEVEKSTYIVTDTIDSISSFRPLKDVKQCNNNHVHVFLTRFRSNNHDCQFPLVIVYAITILTQAVEVPLHDHLYIIYMYEPRHHLYSVLLILFCSLANYFGTRNSA